MLEVEELPAIVPVKRGHPMVAWLVIGIFVLAIRRWVTFVRRRSRPD